MRRGPDSGPARRRLRRLAGALATLLVLGAGVGAGARTAWAGPAVARLVAEPAWPTSAGAPAPREVSALAWDAARQELVAASDRGRLWFLVPGARPGDAWQLRATGRVPGPDGAPGRVDVEAATWRDGGAGPQLWFAAESGALAWALDARGEVADRWPWPAALRQSQQMVESSGSRPLGVEAMDIDPRHGLVVAAERSSRPAAERLHTLYATDGGRWSFEPAGPSSRIKAIEVLAAGDWLVLERLAHGPSRYQAVLRRLDARACGGERRCTAPVVPWQPALPPGADNFEGLACDATRRCWIASDSGGGTGHPVRLLQWQLETQP